MNLKTTSAAAIAAVLMAGGGQAATFSLDSLAQCSDASTGSPTQGDTSGTNGIQINDVTGNAGGATDCWGTSNGNDTNLTGDKTDGTSNFSIGGMKYSFVSKMDIETDPNDDDVYTGQERTGTDIGLNIADDDWKTTKLPASSGTWSVDATKFAPYGDFLISLKAANSPGFAVWLFSGTDADSISGTWNVAWNKDLSHLSIYAKGATDIAVMPLPAAGWLLLAGIGGLAAFRRRKSV